MKQFIVPMAFVLLVGCGSNEQKADTAAAPAEEQQSAKNADPEVDRGLQLVAQSDCLTCHQIKDQLVGPAYEAIAAKYPNNPAVVDSLAAKIIKGGVGNWGNVPMTAHPTLSEADAKAMVKYVLSLKQ